MRHDSVLLKEAVDALEVVRDGVYVDATFGAGGHSMELLKRLGEKGVLFGFDRDLNELQKAMEDERLVLRHNNFSDILNVLRVEGALPVNGVVADLGVSSMQFDQIDRGFSYRGDAGLDMRMNSGANVSALDVLNSYSEEKLWYMFSDLGEIKNSKTLAAAIVKFRNSRKLHTTQELAFIAEQNSYGNTFRYLSQVFQAVRMEVNDELGELERFLSQLCDLVAIGGRAAVITFHSLEDRYVKNYFKTGSIDGQVQKDDFGKVERPFRPVNKKPILPGKTEVEFNKRARSAKLRVGERINKL